MDWLTFIAEIFKAAIWPILLAVVLFALRKPIRELISLLKTLKFGDFEAEFDRRISSVRVEIEEVSERQERAKVDVDVPRGPVFEFRATLFSRRSYLKKGEHALVILARDDRRGAVREAWRNVADAVLEATRRPHPDFRGRADNAIRILAREGAVDPILLSAYLELKDLQKAATDRTSSVVFLRCVGVYSRCREDGGHTRLHEDL